MLTISSSVFFRGFTSFSPRFRSNPFYNLQIQQHRAIACESSYAQALHVACAVVDDRQNHPLGAS